ncbi:Sporulation-delaying protein SdpB [compost metagenome]
MMTLVKNTLSKLISSWDRFWFAPTNLLGLAYMRILLCGTLAIMYIIRSFNLEYYTDQSWIPRIYALKIMQEGYRPPFLWFFWPDSMGSLMHTILVVLLVLLTLGIGGRWLMWAAWLIDLAFVQRNYGVNFGADLIGSIFLFYMMFTQSCERLSVLSLWRKKKNFKSSDLLSSLMIRMMQIQICVIYAYTGFEKLKGASWWDGTALWSVMANPQITTMDFSFLRFLPWSIALFGFITVLFEIYFPVMVAWKKTRYLWLILGFGMHFGIGASMALWNFSALMVSTYFLFIEPSILEPKLLKERFGFLKKV